jgi:hypothetical protein
LFGAKNFRCIIISPRPPAPSIDIELMQKVISIMKQLSVRARREIWGDLCAAAAWRERFQMRLPWADTDIAAVRLGEFVLLVRDLLIRLAA